MQEIKLPMEYLRVTQNYGNYESGKTDYTSYSHTGSYALDLGGKDMGKDWLYAPCDVIVKRIYGVYNAVWFETIDTVLCADKTRRKLIIMLLHMDGQDMQEIDLKVGKLYRQGEKFYREGSAGAVGNHVHLEVGLAPFTGTGWAKTDIKDRTGAYVWKINKQLKPHDVFFLDKTTNCLNDGNITWIKLDEKDDAIKVLEQENQKLKNQIKELCFALEKINSIVDSL